MMQHSGLLLLLYLCSLAGLVLAAGNSTSTVARAIAWKAERWDNDFGPWSSFHIRVGSNQHNARVFPATGWQEVLVVLPEACAALDNGTTDKPCYNSRGLTVNVSDSTTWRREGNKFFKLRIDQDLGSGGNGEYGLDTVALDLAGSSGPVLGSQVVGGFINQTIPLGIFGLNDDFTNFTDYNHPQPSFLRSLYNRKMIPSRSFGLFVGAIYRLKGVLGQVVFGGYDSSAFVPNNATFTMTYDAPDEYRHLVLAVQSVVISGPTLSDDSTPVVVTDAELNGNSSKRLPMKERPFLARVDSSTPYIFLPDTTLNRISQHFHLPYDTDVGLYYFPTDSVGNRSYAAAQGGEISFNFKLTDQLDTDTKTSKNVVDIQLPFQALDLAEMTSISGLQPLKRRYLPFKAAATADSYTLGRAFLQEAYVIADFHRKIFRLHQASFKPNSTPVYVDIDPPGSNSTSTTKSSEHHKISVMALIGIIIACVLVIGFGPMAVFFVIRANRPVEVTDHRSSSRAQELDGTADAWPYHEVHGDNRPPQELENAVLRNGRTSRSRIRPLNSEPIEMAVAQGPRYVALRAELEGDSFAPDDIKGMVVQEATMTKTRTDDHDENGGVEYCKKWI